MSRVIVQGNALGTGSVTVESPNTDNTYTQTLAAVGGTLAPHVSGTAQNSTSVTFVDFTGIPAWAKRVTVMFSGVSTNGTSSVLVQIGASAFATSGYVSVGGRTTAGASVEVTSTAGFIVAYGAANQVLYLQLTLVLADSNFYNSAHFGGSTGTVTSMAGGGTVTLSGVLDRVRITTANGTDVFDAGTINLLWE